jgi:hypothetical protein
VKYEEVMRNLDILEDGINRLTKQRDDFLEALKFYANPESYHATALWTDKPCGSIADDYSEDHGHSYYSRPMLGQRARAALRKHGIEPDWEAEGLEYLNDL